MVRYAVVAAAILLVPLSGCIDALLGGDSDGTITRTVRFDLDDRSIAAAESASSAEAAFDAVTKTFFTYTHRGDAVDVADITVGYTAIGGDEVERPLADFTGLSSLDDGDRVTITGAAPYSGLALSSGDVLAQRTGVAADWFTAGGSPVPLAGSPGSEAAWKLEGDAEQSLAFDRLQASSSQTYTDYDCGYDGEVYSCDERDVHESFDLQVDDARYGYGAHMDGTIDLTVAGDGAGGRVDVDVDGHFDLSLFLDSLIDIVTTSDGVSEQESFPFGVNASLEADGDSLLRMRYDDGGKITAVGTEGSFTTSGSVKMWDMDHSKQAPDQVLGGTEFPSQSSDYEEEPVALGSQAPADSVALMEAIYGMDLVPGDRFELIVDVSEEGFAVDVDLEVVVAARENVRVDAGDIDALRIESSLLLDIDPGYGSPQSIQVQGMTHWVHARTYLPVLIQADASDMLADGEMERLIRDAIDAYAEIDPDTTIDLPDLDIQTHAGGRIELTSMEGDLRVPAVFSAMSVWSPMAMVGPAVMFVLVSDLGGAPYVYEEYDAPVASFPNVAVNEGSTGGWIEMEHLGGDCIFTSDYAFRIDGVEVTPSQSEGSAAMFCVGDTMLLDSGADGQAVEITVVDTWAQAMVYQKTIQL